MKCLKKILESVEKQFSLGSGLNKEIDMTLKISKQTQTTATDMLKLHEGCELNPYTCTSNRLSIGYGRNIEDRGITLAEANYLLKNDIVYFGKQLWETYAWYRDLDEIRQAVCIDMAFNLGMGGFSQFKKMHAAMAIADYDKAANEMLNSRWANQVGFRSTRLAATMTSGVWYG